MDGRVRDYCCGCCRRDKDARDGRPSAWDRGRCGRGAPCPVASALGARGVARVWCLMRHPNQVLTPAQIAERVWDYNFEGTTNRVAVYISYLRDKIDEGRSPKLIQTVYGVGYRLSG